MISGSCIDRRNGAAGAIDAIGLPRLRLKVSLLHFMDPPGRGFNRQITAKNTDADLPSAIFDLTIRSKTFSENTSRLRSNIMAAYQTCLSGG